jgi:hypothetical protein
MSEKRDAPSDDICPDCLGTGRDGASSAPCPTCLKAQPHALPATRPYHVGEELPEAPRAADARAAAGTRCHFCGLDHSAAESACQTVQYKRIQELEAQLRAAEAHLLAWAGVASEKQSRLQAASAERDEWQRRFQELASARLCADLTQARARIAALEAELEQLRCAALDTLSVHGETWRWRAPDARPWWYVNLEKALEHRPEGDGRKP